MIVKKKSLKDWKQAIQLVVNYAAKKGWTVKFHYKNNSFAIPLSKTILINNRHSDRIKYYVLLHELGHAENIESILYISPSKMHGQRYNTLVYRVEKVKEEIDAWEKGQNIAIRNGWLMDDYFYVVQAKFISSYMIWANNRKYYGKHKNRKESTATNRRNTR